MKVLLLGATGLLGHNVLRVLNRRGHEVVALVRRREALRIVPERGRVEEGLLTDRATLSAAAEGCEAVINCAGTTDMSLLRYEDYLPVNRDLCRTLVAVAEERGIGRMVHVSTVNTIGYGTADHAATEEARMRPPFEGSHYADSKREGERCILEAARGGAGRHYVVVNPGFMIGPYDVKPSSGRLLLAGYRRRLMAAPGGVKCFVHVMDVAEAVVNALTEGRSGERYIVAGEAMSLRELYRLQASVVGYRQRVVELPRWAVSAAGRVGDGLRTLRIRTQLSTRNVRQMMVQEHYDSGKAEAELHVGHTAVATAIADFYEWYNKQQEG